MHSCIHFSSQMLIADDYWRNGSTHRKTWGAWALSREGRLLVVTVIKYPVSDFLADAEEKRQPCLPHGCCTSRAVQRKSASFFLGCPSHLNISFALHPHCIRVIMCWSEQVPLPLWMIKHYPMQTRLDSMNPSVTSDNVVLL